ncbi:hypothetical protein [Streptococcus hyointestinalis]|uniref:hypothetical protein n=1 Tax=Streptococcus hyointestinalis TaxID=1337 RepID=UPI0013E06622|nr:hypothetical protein [Streptococcus hyointestinalis]
MADDTTVELLKFSEVFSEHCPCFNCDDGVLVQQYMGTFFNVLARLFCWVDKDCATILKTERQEVIELGDYEVCNCKAIFELKPYYHKGFDPATMRLYLHVRQGLEREIIELDSSLYNWDWVEETFIVDMSQYVKPCCKQQCACACKTTYKLVAVYEAGYTAETIPKCVIESLCHFMNVFIAYQNDCGSLNDCMMMDRLAVGSTLKKKQVDSFVREWEVDDGDINRIYMKLIYKWAFQTLSMLSLCEREYDPRWDVAIGRKKICL